MCGLFNLRLVVATTDIDLGLCRYHEARGESRKMSNWLSERELILDDSELREVLGQYDYIPRPSHR